MCVSSYKRDKVNKNKFIHIYVDLSTHNDMFLYINFKSIFNSHRVIIMKLMMLILKHTKILYLYVMEKRWERVWMRRMKQNWKCMWEWVWCVCYCPSSRKCVNCVLIPLWIRWMNLINLSMFNRYRMIHKSYIYIHSEMEWKWWESMKHFLISKTCKCYWSISRWYYVEFLWL
jgi:hypothetical protein